MLNVVNRDLATAWHPRDRCGMAAPHASGDGELAARLGALSLAEGSGDERGVCKGSDAAEGLAGMDPVLEALREVRSAWAGLAGPSVAHAQLLRIQRLRRQCTCPNPAVCLPVLLPAATAALRTRHTVRWPPPDLVLV